RCPISPGSLGRGFIFVPLAVRALSALPPKKRGNAAGLFNLPRGLGGSIGPAYMSSQLDRHSRAYASYLSERVNVWDANTLDQLQTVANNMTGRVPDPQSGALAPIAVRR